MNEKRVKKMSIELSPVQMVWLHSQHLFQKIEEQSHSKVKFYKNNSGVEVRFQYYCEEQDPELLQVAKEDLSKTIEDNQIRLMGTTLHKDLYLRISKQARKQFPNTYIIFLHYETFQNCCRKLNQKFNITSITSQLEKLRKNNNHFCFLIAEKGKIQDIQKFTMRILHSQVSCASTTFSQNMSRRQQPPAYKRTMSVSSLRGSLVSDENQQQCRLSIHPTITEQQMFEISETALVNLSQAELDKIRRKKKYCGSQIYIQKFEGSYLNMKKKLYYTNRLQLTSSSHIQQVYAYSMIEKNLNRWVLYFITDRKFQTLEQILSKGNWLNHIAKIQILTKVGRALLQLHRHRETYGDLCLKNVLIDSNKCVYLNCFISKDIPPYTNPFLHDTRQYLMLIYCVFTETSLSYQALLKKQMNQQYFCTLSHKAKDRPIREFLSLADDLYLEDISLIEFVRKSQIVLKTI